MGRNLCHFLAKSLIGVSVSGGRLIVEPRPRKRYTFSELMAQCDPDAPLTEEDRLTSSWKTLWRGWQCCSNSAIASGISAYISKARREHIRDL